MRMKLSKTVELLAQMKALGIELSAEGDKLRIDAPKGVLSPSIRELLTGHKTDILQFLHTSKHTGACPLIPAAPRDGHLPASFSQERLWFLAQLEPDSLAYNIPGVLRLTGPLRVEILERCLLEILRRHEALRTTFKKTDGGLAQVISPAGTFHLPLVDLGEVSEPERTELVAKIGIEETRRPFDLSAGPLFRASLVRLGEHEHLLYFTMHHIVTDGWSFGMFNASWRPPTERSPRAAVTIARSAGAVCGLCGLAAGAAAGGDAGGAGCVLEERSWGESLRCCSCPPTGRGRRCRLTGGRAWLLTCRRTCGEELTALSRQQGVTLFMTLLAAFKVLLLSVHGADGLCSGLPDCQPTRGRSWRG